MADGESMTVADVVAKTMDGRLVAPYLCRRRLSSAILGSMVELLDGWVVRGRGRGEGCGARGRPALSRSTIRVASGSAT